MKARYDGPGDFEQWSSLVLNGDQIVVATDKLTVEGGQVPSGPRTAVLPTSVKRMEDGWITADCTVLNPLVNRQG